MNAKKIFFIIPAIILNLIFEQNIFCKNNQKSRTLYITPLDTFIKLHPEAIYKKCFDKTPFNFEPFPLSIGHQNHPNKGYFHETFILKIPNAQIESHVGFIVYKEQVIKELIWKDKIHNLNILGKVSATNMIPIHAKIAVISQPTYHNYWHWLTEVLCRLALLEMHNIEYDFLFVNQEYQFMKDTLELWGINPTKIISLDNDSFYIQADEVIIPSLVSNVNFGFVPFSCYTQPHLLQYVKEKLLTTALGQAPTSKMHKKIFISRKDSHIRNIINEDEIFNLLKPHGFERYELAKLSVVDQIHLFNQAEIIISPQGTGLANSIFCNKNVKIIELFQGLNDATFWYLSQELKLHYHPIQTIEFISDYMTAWQSHTYMPPAIIEKIIEAIR